MVRRCLSGGLTLACAAALSGCGVEETPEGCIERFEKLGGDSLEDALFQPVFTYDITRMENALETIYGDPKDRVGGRVTISHGASGAALQAFYAADVPAKGHMFAADDFTLYRINGTPGSRRETVVAGCRGAFPKARLVHIRWQALPPVAAVT
jgi:hypothetical protein